MIEINYDDKGRIIHQGWRYKAIQELHTRLEELHIPHDFAPLLDGYRIWVPLCADANYFDMDAIQHFGSYGAEDDLLEVWNGRDESHPAGWLTVEQALEFFVRWWEEQKDDQLREIKGKSLDRLTRVSGRGGGDAQVHTSGV